MSITAISTDFAQDPRLIRMTATDNFSVITTAGYWADEQANVIALNNGVFTIADGEMVLATYGDGQGIIYFDEANESFAALPNSGNLTNTLPSAQVFVGNGSNVATPRALTGAIAITNTGVTSINNGAIVAADFAANIVGSDQLAVNMLQLETVALTSTQFKAMYATPVQVLAAPGADQLILIEHVNLLMTYNSAQYTGGGNILLQYGNTVHGGGLAASATIAAANVSGAASDAELARGVLSNGAFTNCVNTAIYISNASAAFATGDSDFVLNIWYKIVPTV